LRDEALEDGAERLLAPFMEGLRTAEQLSTFDPLPALRAALGWDGERRLDAAAPAHFTAPTGTRVPIEYEPGQEPTVRVRLQELFGLVTHPVIGDGRKPLRIVLLSPAQRPVQTTMDLPGFWATSYLDVRKEMRGRYPRHPWPEDPRSADPTRRAKRRAP
ncbi:MAG: ATP-dependent helicase C-terminal domain-containing protein, partial [Rubricella sp.]